MELLERDLERAALEAALRGGRLVVVGGEAGIGKTALVREVVPAEALWGACDPLITPRPFGPWHDIARGAPALAAALSGSREEVLGAALDLLEHVPLVIEDLHWADDATLDLVALVGRRVVHGCVIVTTRPGARAEVVRVLSALRAERIEPRPLSAAAVARLAGGEAGALHAQTGGNPFFVTEALAGRRGLPELSDGARAVLELASVVPGETELWLLDAPAEAVDECIAAGLLEAHGGERAAPGVAAPPGSPPPPGAVAGSPPPPGGPTGHSPLPPGGVVAFRHDLARRAVLDAISPARRRELDLRVLARLEAAGVDDPARLAHHARRAGDWEAIRRLAPLAARAAAAAGGHREALEQWEAALAVGVDALEGVSVEAYLCGHMERAVEARRALVERTEEPLAYGDHLRWLARLLWWSGRGEEAAEVGDRAIAVLEAFPGSRELAMALSARSQLAMLAQESDLAITLGERALAIAADDEEIAIHALTNVASAVLAVRDPEQGRAMLEEAIARATAAGMPDHAARAHVNLVTGTLARNRADPRVVSEVERALAFARDQQLDGYAQYMLGIRGVIRLMGGAWPDAEHDARAALELGHQPGVSLCPSHIVLGKLQSRRGEQSAAETLDLAWRLAVKTGEIQRLAPAAAARAEHAWHNDELQTEVERLREVHGLADARKEAWGRAEMAFWLRRAGDEVPAHADDPLPYALAARGDWAAAARVWEQAGLPFEHADALCEAGQRVEALAIFDALGATHVAARLRRQLRADGVKRIPRGPRPASRAAPGGLTPRESEVYAHLVEGATNAEIAEALVISPKTVDHHVSAVIAKLGVSSRRELRSAGR